VILKESLPNHPTRQAVTTVRAPAYEGLVKRNGSPARVPPTSIQSSWGDPRISNSGLQIIGLITSGNRFRPGVQIQESKPRNPNSGFQTQESEPRNPNPGFQTHEPEPRNPNPGLQTQESKPRNPNPGIQTQESKPRNPSLGMRNQESEPRNSKSKFLNQLKNYLVRVMLGEIRN
jgi:hypothetical protein